MKPSVRTVQLRAVFVACCIGSCSLALGQTWPARTIRLVIPYPPGGSTDLVARLMQPRLAAALGQPLVVENRAGGNATIGTDFVARAAADGYTLLFTTPATHTQVQFTMRHLPYDPVRDFTPITAAVTQSSMLLVHPSLGVGTFRELLDYARRNPGKLSYGIPAIGSNFHLSGEVIKQLTGIDMIAVPYKGGGPVMQALVAGEVPVAMFSNTSAMPALKAGKIKALAVLDSKRLRDFPDVPAMKELLPEFDKPGEWLGFYAPAKLPEPILERLHTEILRAVRLPDVEARLHEVGMEPLGNSPSEFMALIRHDAALNQKLLRLAGVQPE